MARPLEAKLRSSSSIPSTRHPERHPLPSSSRSISPSPAARPDEVARGGVLVLRSLCIWRASGAVLSIWRARRPLPNLDCAVAPFAKGSEVAASRRVDGAGALLCKDR